MDFGSLLYAAKKNDYNRKESKCYVTKFAPPKKEEKSRTLSVNVKKFLEKKEEEEKRKALEERKKRDELLALRSQDGKSYKRVQAMLKRTKAANKSAIKDAVDDNNTAVTIGGCAQPDEDDYGYVSQEASAFYSKLMDKYNSLPQEDSLYSKKKKIVSKDLTSTKDRVKMALQREEEEESLPHKRKRRTKEELGKDRDGDKSPDSRENDYESQVTEERRIEEKPKEKPKPKKMLPPPMDFQTLLKIAEQKQFEPIKIETKKEIKEEEVTGRPMTKKQKAEYQKEMERQMRKQQSNGKSNNIESLKNSKMHDEILRNIRISTSRHSHPKIPRLSDTQENEPSPPIKKTADVKISISSTKSSLQNKPAPEKSKPVSDNFRSNESKPRQYLPGDTRNDSTKTESKAKQYLPGDLRYEGNKSKSNDSRNSIDNNKQSEDRNRSLQNNDKKVSNKEIIRSKQNVSDSKSKDNLNKSRPLNSGVENNKSKLERNGPLAKKSKTSEKQHLSGENAKENKKSDNSSENTKQRQYLPGDLRYQPNQKSHQENTKIIPNKQNSLQGREAQLSNTKMKQEIKTKSEIRPKQFPPADLQRKQFPPADKQRKQFPPADMQRKQFPPADMQRKQFPPADMQRKQFPPADMQKKRFPPSDLQRKFPPKDVKRKPFKRRIESDDEYDSELDDFIDDGPEEGEDYSQHIREIFGYDKSKYVHADDDDDQCMESNFAQQLKEEFVSSKIGIMEDLEDIKKENEEKKRKMMKIKAKKR